MQVRAFIEQLERLAPPSLAEDFDAGKIGLVVEGRQEINRVCCALDATPHVVNTAVMASADMLVVHHTPLWTPLTTMTTCRRSPLQSGMAWLSTHVLSACPAVPCITSCRV